METHAAQDVKMVLMHAGQYPLADGGECAFVVGTKDCLGEQRSMNSRDTNEGGWDACEMRTFLNSNTGFKSSIPPALLPMFRQIKVVTANGVAHTPVTNEDYFTLPAEKEIHGINKYASETAEASLFQLEHYKTAANRIKKWNDSNGWYWNRSPYADYYTMFCNVIDTGDFYNRTAAADCGVSPHGAIGKKVTA